MIQNAKFIQNKATIGTTVRGGAISLAGPEGSPEITISCMVHKNSTFVNNIAGYGGAISTVEAELVIDDTVFLENTAGHGGAVWAQVICYVSHLDLLILSFLGSYLAANTVYNVAGCKSWKSRCERGKFH